MRDFRSIETAISCTNFLNSCNFYLLSLIQVFFFDISIQLNIAGNPSSFQLEESAVYDFTDEETITLKNYSTVYHGILGGIYVIEHS